MRGVPIDNIGIVFTHENVDHEGCDSIYNGADDDASGSVGLIEIAEAFAAQPVKPKRSLVGILVGMLIAIPAALYGALWLGRDYDLVAHGRAHNRRANLRIIARKHCAHAFNALRAHRPRPGPRDHAQIIVHGRVNVTGSVMVAE